MEVIRDGCFGWAEVGCHRKLQVDVNMPAIRWMYLLLLLSTFLWTRCLANDFLGCGGYVRSDVDINYAQVGVKL